MQQYHRKDSTVIVPKKPDNKRGDRQEDIDGSGKPSHAEMITSSPYHFVTPSKNPVTLNYQKGPQERSGAIETLYRLVTAENP